MRHISSVDSYECLKVLVKQDLRDLGIKVPKTKKKRLSCSKYPPPDSGQEPSRTGGIFGNYLSHVPCVHVPNCGYVPKFLVDAVSFIESHIDREGLFRKSGSVTRQKDLKQNIEEGRGIVEGNVYDVTSLIKQFFRELPEPLFTSAFHDAFIKCFQLGDDEDATKAVLMLCLLLPGEHLSTLRFMMLLLDKISKSCDKNKMDAGNLAVVLAPNIMHVNNKTEKMNSSEEKLLQVQTAIVELLIRNAGDISMACDSLCERAAMMTEVFGTDDELDASEEILEESRDNSKKKEKKRKRSGSLQGIVSTITQSLSKWRRNSDGKSNTSNASQMSNMSNNASQVSGKSTDSSMASIQKSIDMTAATPVLMRKRKASGETVPFSASKKKAILQQLPKQAILAHTPFTPATAMKKLDIRSMKKNMMDTPSITFSNDSQMSFNATPRKRLSLFSPNSTRKSKKKMGSLLCFTRRRPPSGLSSSRSLPQRHGSTSHLSIQPSGKKKRRSLFRRFSGGKADKVSESESDSITQIGNRLATSSNSKADKCSRSKSPRFRKRSKSCSPKHKAAHRSQSCDGSLIAAVMQNVMSPSYTEESVLSQNDDTGSLNDGFIALEDEQQNNLNVVSKSTDNIDHCCPRNALSDTCMVDGKEINESLSKSHRRSFSADDSLDTTVKRQLRRGQPNTIATGLLHSKQHDVAKLRRSFGLDKSEISYPIPLIIPELSKDVKALHVFNSITDSQMETTESTSLEVAKCRISTEPSANDTLNIILPPPSAFADISMNVQMAREKAYDSDESEAGFSTISGGTVIYNPGIITLPSEHKTVYRSISAATTQQVEKAKTVKSFNSVDSLFSEQSESSPPRRDFSRSNSTDSGKGSLLDSSISKDENLQTEIDKTPLKAQKSVSSQDLDKNSVTMVNRSQSLLEGSMYRKNNIKPNLQISLETHTLLSRAGYMEDKSIPPGTADVEVVSANVPTIKRAEAYIRKHENVLDMKEAQSGKVGANVKHINDKLKQDPDVTQRHSSVLRFPNSVTRKRGCSPIRIPSLFIKNEKEINHLREAMQSSGMQRLANGTAKLPISTQLLKPMEKAASVATQHNKLDPNGSFKRMPSIYYAKDERQPVVNVHIKNIREERVDYTMMENSVNNSFRSSMSTENQLKEIEQSKENECGSKDTLTNQTQCLFKGNPVYLDNSLLQTINEVCTPLSEKYWENSDKVGKTSLGKTNLDKEHLKAKNCGHIGKTPVIKQPVLQTPVSEKAVLQTAGGNTPRFVMRKPYSPGKRSPMKPVKRLGSPRSPCRSSPLSKSPRRPSHSPKKVVGNTVCGTLLSSVPSYLQNVLDDL